MTPPTTLSRAPSLLPVGRLVLGVLAAAVLFAEAARAQPERPDSAEALQLGTLLQVVAQPAGPLPGAAGRFRIANARLGAEGQPSPRLSYELEADFADGFELLDARISYRLLPPLRLDAGRFKTPFSFSALTSTAETPFVQRPRVVNALRLGRQTGLAFRYRPRSAPVVLRGGVFNGIASDDSTGGPPTSGDLLLYVGRVAWETSGPDRRASLGVNAAYDASSDEAGPHAGLRYGADVHVERAGVFVTAEALLRAEPQPGLVSSGAYVTAGYAPAERHRLRARLDYVRMEDAGPGGGSGSGGSALAEGASSASYLLGLGYTLRPGGPLRLEVDYLVPLAAPGLEESVLLVNLQMSL